MPNDVYRKTETQEAKMTPQAIAEDMRGCLPIIAAPISPCEPVASWLARAARHAGITAARARAYWHRKVESPRADEYIAVMAAAEAAKRKTEFMERAYDAERNRLARDFPALARFLPPSLAETSRAED